MTRRQWSIGGPFPTQEDDAAEWRMRISTWPPKFEAMRAFPLVPVDLETGPYIAGHMNVTPELAAKLWVFQIICWALLARDAHQKHFPDQYADDDEDDDDWNSR